VHLVLPTAAAYDVYLAGLQAAGDVPLLFNRFANNDSQVTTPKRAR
jgi:hypothetical protein